jgi:S-DNA-T family DNA segregation ATPase FtsK/SpoIIIE
LGVAVYAGLSLTGEAGPLHQVITGDTTGQLFPAGNPGGPVGSVLNVALRLVFGGIWCWAFPVLLGVTALGYLFKRSFLSRGFMLKTAALWLVSATWLAQPDGPFDLSGAVGLGGVTGFWIARGFHGMFGIWGGRIFLSLFMLLAFGLIFRPWLGWVPGLFVGLGRGIGHGLASLGRAIMAPLRGLSFPRPGRSERPAPEAGSMAVARNPEPAAEEFPGDPAPKERVVHNIPEPDAETGEELWDDDSAEAMDEGPPPEERVLPGAAGEFAGDGSETIASPEKPRKKKKVKKKSGPVTMPGIDLLTPAGPETQQVRPEELDASADLLEATLKSFGVEGEVRDVRPGPVVTTFEYQPGPGIRVSQIVQRSDDLALAMRARSIRMEAPIPGKAAVGIEIPNPTARMVRLREVLELTGTQQREPLSVVLGKDVVGRPVSVDLAALPHLLVAGSTGSGKSVCLNAIISNLLLRNDPSRLRMVLIDPKMLEMNVYNGIPHLLLPVVTDPRESLKAMQWMVAQMEHRYRTLAKCSVRNIQQYNAKIEAGLITDNDGDPVTEPMPYYLTIVDELADLMLQLGNDFEGPITRLAQKARAVGIHLILATQRPSVDVLTGVIKANIPCRIAFRVIQKNDSRTILDMNGAEQLLGHGDMLYLQPGRALPVRVHGSFIDVDECEAITAHWQSYSDTTEEISLNENPAGGGMVTGEDDLFEDARRVVVLHQSGSTSLLQRRLRIGYTRAGRLMDMLEEAGIVGPFTGSKARDVLIKPEDLPEADAGEA